MIIRQRYKVAVLHETMIPLPLCLHIVPETKQLEHVKHGARNKARRAKRLQFRKVQILIGIGLYLQDVQSNVQHLWHDAAMKCAIIVVLVRHVITLQDRAAHVIILPVKKNPSPFFLLKSFLQLEQIPVGVWRVTNLLILKGCIFFQECFYCCL